MAKETNPTPEPGQVWADNDERSVGSGEFTIVSITDGVALVMRSGGRNSHIRLDRLADTGARGYRYIGKSR